MSPSAMYGPPSSYNNGGGPVGTENMTHGGNVGTANLRNGYGKPDTKAPTGRVFKHLKDLSDSRPDQTIDHYSSMRKLIDTGLALAKYADTNIDFRRQDLAYEAHVQALVIATEYIRKNQEWPTMMSRKQEPLYRDYMELSKRLMAQDGRLPELKEAIEENNLRNGVVWSKDTRVASNNEVDSNRATGKESLPVALEPRRKAPPPVQPKPDALHGNALVTSTKGHSSSETPLEARFAALRKSPLALATINPSKAPAQAQDPRIRTQSITGKHDNTNGWNVFASPKSSNHSPATSLSGKFPNITRPAGPRDAPLGLPANSLSPTKIKLDVSFPNMPRPPDAIYSPSVDKDPTTTHLPSSISRNFSNYSSAPPISKTIRTPSISEAKENSYFSFTHTAPSSGVSNDPKRKKKPIPERSDTVSAGDLVEYLEEGSNVTKLLLIDVRSRAEFDRSHIVAPCIICIEPLDLSEGISADQLEDKLVMSPETELKLFKQRKEFELIVMYDQNSVTLTTGSTTGTVKSSPLSILKSAIFEYGYEHQPRLAPKFLYGGINAFVMVRGPDALRSSFGATHTSPLANKPTVETATTQPTDNQHISKSGELQSPTATGGDSFAYYKTANDFHTRFPPVPESMVSSTSLPRYNVNSSGFSQPPARPAPALPRQKSSGLSERGSNSYTVAGHGSITAAKHKKYLTGITNFGSSCYASSVLQCFCASVDLRNFLLNYKYLPGIVPRKYRFKMIFPESEDKDKDQKGITENGVKQGNDKQKSKIQEEPKAQLVKTDHRYDEQNLEQPLTRNLANVMVGLTSGNYQAITPTLFWNNLRELHALKMSDHASLLGGQWQQDTGDLVVFLLENMLDELNKYRDRPDYTYIGPRGDEAIYASSQLPIYESAASQWALEANTARSPIHDLFIGQKVLTTTCPVNSSHMTRRWQQFNHIPILLNPEVSNLHSPRSLWDLLDDSLPTAFFGDATSAVTCFPCGKAHPKTPVQERISYFPKYLILYFQRFTGPSAERISSEITGFDSNSIDLSRYSVLPQDVPPPSNVDLSNLPGLKGPFVYQCYGAIFHIGNSIRSGHYTAMTRHLDQAPTTDAGKWNYYNDTKVSPVNKGPEFGDPLSPSSGKLVMMFLRRKHS